MSKFDETLERSLGHFVASFSVSGAVWQLRESCYIAALDVVNVKSFCDVLVFLTAREMKNMV